MSDFVSLSEATLLALLLVAAVTDIWRNRIYNWNTYPGILLGMLVNWYEAGGDGLGMAVGGFLACGLIMLFCFVFFRIGGGDVKLIAMMGAFLGPAIGIEALLWTFVIGSVFALIRLIWSVGAARIFRTVGSYLRLMLMARGPVPMAEADREPLKQELFLAPAALLAAVTVLYRHLSWQ